MAENSHGLDGRSFTQRKIWSSPFELLAGFTVSTVFLFLPCSGDEDPDWL
jgi:hypothetical protein